MSNTFVSDSLLVSIYHRAGNFIEDNTSKPYRISFEHRPQYLYVYVSGEHDSYRISRQYWLEISSECNKTGYKKVLIDEDIKETVSIAEVFQLVTEFPKMEFHGVCIAFYDRYAAHHELNEFGELVATNRGLTGKVFNDYNEAENWLLERIDFKPNSPASDSTFRSDR